MQTRNTRNDRRLCIHEMQTRKVEIKSVKGVAELVRRRRTKSSEREEGERVGMVVGAEQRRRRSCGEIAIREPEVSPKQFRSKFNPGLGYLKVGPGRN